MLGRNEGVLGRPGKARDDVALEMEIRSREGAGHGHGVEEPALGLGGGLDNELVDEDDDDDDDDDGNWGCGLEPWLDKITARDTYHICPGTTTSTCGHSLRS